MTVSAFISGTTSAQSVATSFGSPAAAAAATQPASPAPAPAVTVTLSQSAQVSQLSAQGQSPAQIAEELGIPVSTVDLDLGIVAANAASQVAAAPKAAAPAAATAPKTVSA
jgi:DNA-binding NarL/FixJ family response regulator